ncbi:hypothetical protein HanPSC8_Chr03g0091091 [Helianthus annuus]|nr:hypothetical protein HanPSC8_Chr03g0091091 [Helianthus annuus]
MNLSRSDTRSTGLTARLPGGCGWKMVAMTQRSTVWWPDLPFEVEGTGQILTQFHGKIYLNFQLVCSRSRLL